MVLTLPKNVPHFSLKIEGLKLTTIDFEIKEAISHPFVAHFSLASESPISLEETLEKAAVFQLMSLGDSRYLHGQMERFTYDGYIRRFHLYKAIIRPTVWFLSYKQDRRIFQEMTVPQIVEKLLKEHGITGDLFQFNLQATYVPREYCVQFSETDFHFISRLLEEEGIFYFFDHNRERTQIIFGDSTTNYTPVNAGETIAFNANVGKNPDNYFIHGFKHTARISSGEYAHKDYNFIKPSLDLTSDKTDQKYSHLKRYDFPGKFKENPHGKSLSAIHLEQQTINRLTTTGRGNNPHFNPGFTHTMTDHPLESACKEYLITDVFHRGQQPQILEEGAPETEESSYFNEYTAIPSTVTLRPTIQTPKPEAQGIHSAFVTGPPGEEIYTDSYGRVKVQFHWDRYGEMNEKSSCWLRVSNSFAGKTYGTIFTPRIGQEIFVAFLEGDPDRPYIKGRGYNELLPPPYPLPDEKTKSTMKTSTSPGSEGFNEIRFEDKKGDEEIFIHGEKNMDSWIANDKRTFVGNESHTLVHLPEKPGDNSGKIFTHIQKDTHLFIENNSTLEIKNHDHHQTGADTKISISGMLSETITGNVAFKANANHSVKVSGDSGNKAFSQVVIEAGAGITFKCGGSFITLNAAGIYIKANKVDINEGGSPLRAKPVKAETSKASKLAEIAGTANPGWNKAVKAMGASMQAAAQSDIPFCLNCMLNALGHQKSEEGGKGEKVANPSGQAKQINTVKPPLKAAGTAILKVNCDHGRKAGSSNRLQIVADPTESFSISEGVDHLEELPPSSTDPKQKQKVSGFGMSLTGQKGGSDTISCILVPEPNKIPPSKYEISLSPLASSPEWYLDSERSYPLPAPDNTETWPMSTPPHRLYAKGKADDKSAGQITIEHYPSQWHDVTLDLNFFNSWINTINESLEKMMVPFNATSPVDITPEIIGPTGSLSAAWGWKEENNDWRAYYCVELNVSLDPIIGFGIKVELSLAQVMVPGPVGEFLGKHVADAFVGGNLSAKVFARGGPQYKFFTDGKRQLNGKLTIGGEGGLDVELGAKAGSEYILQFEAKGSGYTSIIAAGDLTVNKKGVFLGASVDLGAVTLSVSIKMTAFYFFPKKCQKSWDVFQGWKIYPSKDATQTATQLFPRKRKK